MILIPAQDEGPRIGGVVIGCMMAMPKVEVVVVANGCTDDTVEQAMTAGATVIASPPGYGEALVAGYTHALDRWAQGQGPQWLVQLDGDGQHPPAAIPQLVAGLDKADLVIGSRLAPGGSAEGWPIQRRAAVTALGWWTSFVLKHRIRDVASGFQAMRPPVVAALTPDFPRQMADANVLVRAHQRGFIVREMGVEMIQRLGGESMHGGWKSWLYAGRMAISAAEEARR
jgi:glycosyltransferase involved in cell wall biosynthesis